MREAEERNKEGTGDLHCWNKEQLHAQLFAWQDESYRAFQHRLIPTQLSIIGVRMPRLHALAKEFARGELSSFLQQALPYFFEEVLLQGLAIGKSTVPLAQKFAWLQVWLQRVDNWALCDLTAASLKELKKREEQSAGFAFARGLTEAENPWMVRFGWVLWLDYFINDSYIDEILLRVVKLETDAYTVQMAVAWLLSLTFIRYPERVQPHLKRAGRLDERVRKMAIQKCVDSRRVPQEVKEELRRWRKNL